jgi:23S rRNA (adenine2503-C2)-methyltransferase
MTSPPADPVSLSREEWRAFAAGIGEPEYRGAQIHRWIQVEAVGSFADMTNLSKDLRARLSELLPGAFAEPAIRQTADAGTTEKALFRAADGAVYETVLMAYEDRATVCVSSQAGCGMGCPFCATGQMGLLRNLEAGEIAAQVIWAARELRLIEGLPEDWPRRVSNVVFMGMGEPLANYDRVWKAVERIHDPEGFNLSARSITISTVGVLPGIKRLAAERLPVGLALSLHAPEDALRAELVPLNERYPIAALLEACRELRRAHGRRVSIEYAMIGGVNDSPAHARRLAALLAPDDFHVNLIPLNPTPGFGAPATPASGIQRFRGILAEGGINATVRRNRGTDIDAACGQLGARATRSEVPAQG